MAHDAPSAHAALPPQAAQIGMILQAALAHHQSGRHAQAEALYRQALTIDPRNFDGLHMLGVLVHQLGRHAEAIDLISQALGLHPAEPFALNNLGEANRAMGRFAEAETCLRKALALMPQYAEAHNNLGLALQAQVRLEEAETCFQKAVSFKPDYAKAYHNLGCLYKAQGKMHKALLGCQKALQLQPADAGYWLVYADIVRLLPTEAINAVEPFLLLQAFGKENLDPQSLERVASAAICDDPAVQALLASANDSRDDTLRIEQALSDGVLAAFAGMPLLLSLLEETVVTNYRLERLLVAVRRALLMSFIHDDAALQAEPWTGFVSALALQCFANEYLYAVTAEEEQAVSRLTEIVATAPAIAGHSAATALMLLGSYRALHRLSFAEKIPASGWPTPIQKVIERQLNQPLQEEHLKREIPRLTAIEDQVSQAVRQQYEENPYPRWRRRGNIGQGLSIHAGLQRRFPHQKFSSDSPQHPEILVAGCGTGSDAVQVANAFANARILAVDMSLSSLAYAKRATQAFGIANIEFGQADILELAALNRQFDVVVCSGVLHHMQDPMAGWSVLTQLLRPGGYMNVGLYSRRARTEITALRELIRKAGYSSTLAGIRQFRADAMTGKCSADVASLLASPDFYSASACRDLVFHVQEHVVSPLEIQASLEQLGLQFIGFELPNPEARKRYLERFPDNPACDSLGNWEMVELDHPQIFAGMYQFWTGKV